MSICVLHPNFGCLIWHCALFCQNASSVYTSGPGPWEVSLASSGTLWIMTLTSHGLNVTSDPLSSCGITSNSNSYSFHDCLDGLWRQGVCVVHSMHTGFWTVLGDVPQLVTVVTGLRWVLGLCMIQVHGLQVCSCLAAGGGGHG